MNPTLQSLKDVPWNKTYGMSLSFANGDIREEVYRGVRGRVWRTVQTSTNQLIVDKLDT